MADGSSTLRLQLDRTDSVIWQYSEFLPSACVLFVRWVIASGDWATSLKGARLIGSADGKAQRSGLHGFSWPNYGQKKSTVLQGFYVVGKSAIKHQEVSCGEIEYVVLHMHPNVARDNLDRYPAGGLMFMQPRFGFQNRQDDPKVPMFHQRF
jgi:hypothetical protein